MFFFYKNLLEFQLIDMDLNVAFKIGNKMKSSLLLALFTFIQATLCVPQQGNRPFNPAVPPFRPTTVSYSAFEADDTDASQSQLTPTKIPSYSENPYPFKNALPLIQQRPQTRNEPLQQFRRPQEFRHPSPNDLEDELKEKEEEEPDRLSVLLPQSKFDCTGKNTGYYADEGLGCEVFHYCQDNAKHSWICPEGFSFHQVHLICMPTGHDNICTQSTKYHFVNEYLYKPINLEEHQSKPNITLRYSERFYPDNYNYQQEYNDEDVEQPPKYKQPARPHAQITQTPAPYRPVQVPKRPYPSQFTPTYRPETTLQQVFRSPEEKKNKKEKHTKIDSFSAFSNKNNDEASSSTGLVTEETVVECENKQNDKLKSPNLITQDQDPVATNISTNNSSTAVDTVASSTSVSDLNSTISLSAALHEDSAPTSIPQTNFFL
ncbi:hypothetical protein RN001_001731 [Aquatica leii]|uniref:Chitin-binding type-2 domain-containing protein n=1 Tax=Aquatica leii TaxID=1421715 RepID=A0AAN7PC40_9COLE|nr:hypothetical protein RN001_001731 [Aquatica leii]